MPHTSRKKNVQRTKRTEVTDEDGWTRVTTTNASQRSPRPLPAYRALMKRYSDMNVTHPKCVLPKDKTCDQVEAHYRKFENQWLESVANEELARVLKNEINVDLLRDIDKCILFGSGSFSGLLLDWIDRSHISMYQLAAFLSAIDTIEHVTGKRPKVFAQEPIYTTLDIEFLSRLNVEIVKTPAGFEELTSASFAYAPGAEQDVILRILVSNPAIVMQNGKFDRYWRNEKGEACTDTMHLHIKKDDIGCDDEKDSYKGDIADAEVDLEDHQQSREATEDRKTGRGFTRSIQDEIEQALHVVEDFQQGKRVKRLPSVDVKDQPFHDLHIYYRES